MQVVSINKCAGAVVFHACVLVQISIIYTVKSKVTLSAALLQLYEFMYTLIWVISMCRLVSCILVTRGLIRGA